MMGQIPAAPVLVGHRSPGTNGTKRERAHDRETSKDVIGRCTPPPQRRVGGPSQLVSIPGLFRVALHALDETFAIGLLQFSGGDTLGFIARDDTREEIVVSFCGTFSVADVATDVGLFLVPFVSPGINESFNVHSGFLSAYKDGADDVLSTFQAQYAQFPSYNIVVTGHSLGGSLAALGAVSLKTEPSGRPDEALHLRATEYWQFEDVIGSISPPRTVKQCVGEEDPTCSDSIPSTGINAAHVFYFGQVPAFAEFLSSADAIPMATAAANGSFLDIQKIMIGIAQAPDSPEAILFLPVCWANLDPAGIPSPHQLDILLANSDASHIPKGPFLALETIQFLPRIPRLALLDLWERVWPWMQFFNTYRDIVPTSPTYLALYGVFFAYIDRIPVSLVASVPGFRTLVAKAWMAFIAQGDTAAPGFRQLLNFVASHSVVPICDAHVAEYSAGAGGTLDHLAELVCSHLTMAHREENLAYVRSGVRFALAIEPKGVFHESLCNRGMVALLTEITWDLTGDLWNSDDVADVSSECLVLVALELSRPDGYRWIPSAIRSGLLDAIVHLADVREVASDNCVRRLLQQIQGSTVYYSVLHELERQPPSLLEVARHSPIFSQWTEFVSLTDERLKLKSHFDSAQYVTYRACDYLACGRIMQKSQFKSCAGCRTTCYCDSSCQRYDWVDHRASCGTLRAIHLSDPLTPRNKSFIRALVQHTYQRNLHHIFELQLTAARQSSPKAGGASMIRHSYDDKDTGGVHLMVVEFRPPQEYYTLPATDWTRLLAYYQARARRDPRIQLHLVSFPGQEQPRIFSMWSADTRVHEGLVRIARRKVHNGNAETFEEEDRIELDALERLSVMTIFT
ncbi:hypothetical protein C8R44DRAFT_878935 [Mycena epipterygia]|nr:hypothetical protein C8R44DRAFT_878935 [Mycena epipterygia]